MTKKVEKRVKHFFDSLIIRVGGRKGGIWHIMLTDVVGDVWELVFIIEHSVLVLPIPMFYQKYETSILTFPVCNFFIYCRSGSSIMGLQSLFI